MDTGRVSTTPFKERCESVYRSDAAPRVTVVTVRNQLGRPSTVITGMFGESPPARGPVGPGDCNLRRTVFKLIPPRH